MQIWVDLFSGFFSIRDTNLSLSSSLALNVKCNGSI